jgi:hypothetical protein
MSWAWVRELFTSKERHKRVGRQDVANVERKEREDRIMSTIKRQNERIKEKSDRIEEFMRNVRR